MRHLLILICLAPLLLWGQSSNPVEDAYATGNDCYVITDSQMWELGAVWFNEPVNLNNAFEIELEINFGSLDANGADGVVFVFQQVGVNAIGLAGGGMGFDGFFPSIGIEMDTWDNPETADPTADHMALFAHGETNHNSALQLAGPVNTSPLSTNVEDGQYHPFKLTWDPAAQLIEVFFDCELRISYQIDLINTIFDGDPVVYWGFTGATGGSFNTQTVCISEFALGLPDEFQICNGESVELGLSGSQSDDYLWTPATGLDDPTSATPIASPAETTTYEITITDLCGQETTLSTTVEVFDVDVDLPEFILACEGEEVEVTVDSNAPEINWSNGDEGQTANPTVSGPLTVETIADNCSAEATTEVVFHPLPITLELEDNYSACEGETITINADAQWGQIYDWASGEDSEIIEVTESGTYEVTVISQDDCIATFSTEVEFIAIPVVDLPTLVELCEGQTTTLSPGSAQNTNWDTGETTPTLTVDQPGTYTVVLSNGDCTAEGSTEVTFDAAPIFSWPNEISYCSDTLIYQALPDNDLVWTVNGDLVTDSVLVANAESLTLTGTNATSGCSTSYTADVTVLYAPLVTLPEAVVLCEGQATEVTAATDAPDNSFWDEGTEGPTAILLSEGEYMFTAVNECGSTSASLIAIEGLCDCPLFVPNAFTPDLDGRNELFYPSLACDVDDYTFSVHNRWGEQLFLTKVQGQGWNGAAPGRTHYVQDDVYIWRVTYEVVLFDRVEVVEEVGHVVVLR
ncbi:MAG: gliding motility-associated C-terminal domain-containing protein [Flavobacteriales bacterium]|nr:gliding motility-associated C-terminal domain-containing protein [Flavobacteriales bacterium]